MAKDKKGRSAEELIASAVYLKTFKYWLECSRAAKLPKSWPRLKLTSSLEATSYNYSGTRTPHRIENCYPRENTLHVFCKVKGVDNI